MDLEKNKTNSQSRQFVIILQNQGPSQGVQHMHHFLVVCWVSNIVDIKTVNKYVKVNISATPKWSQMTYLRFCLLRFSDYFKFGVFFKFWHKVSELN